MDLLEFLNIIDPAELTVREQARVQDNLPDLQWDGVFPRQNVSSTRLMEITETDFRPVADRREWDADGRNIPLQIGPKKDIEIVPIEAYHTIGEREMQRLLETNGMNRQLALDAFRARIPQRGEKLVDAVYRRIEFEAFQGWALNEFKVRNAQTGKEQTVALQIDSNRYLTPTPWTTSNAYEKFLEAAYNAQDAIGQVGGARMRQTTLLAIQESAPKIGANSVRMTRVEVQDRISQELGSGFEITVDERTVDLFNSAGTKYTRTKIFPEHRVCFVPANGVAGNTFFAPQWRSQAVEGVAEQFVDVRGVNVYRFAKNNGKSLLVQAQLNALSMPNEQDVYVVNAGV